MADNLKLITADNDLYGKLIIPTQSEGATINQTTVGARGSTFSVSSSGGSVKQDDYENYITRFRASSEHIELGLVLYNEIDPFNPGKMDAKRGLEPDRTLRIPMGEITDVRQTKVETHPGIVFETTEDVYQCKVAVNNGRLSSSKNFDTRPLERAAELTKQEMGGPSTTSETHSTEDSSTDSTSLTDELERLADLHERGALSDEEFEQAKRDLLD
jgi:hypothetical protein